MNENKQIKRVLWFGVIMLGVLHQDFWYWSDTTMVFGFIPVGLFYHAMFSVVAAGVWAMMVRFAWPHRIEQWADELENEQEGEV